MVADTRSDCARDAKMKRPICGLVVVIATVLAGCATPPPPVPPIQSQRGDRIGVFVDIGDSPTHTHIGTTVFHNFEKTYTYHWDLKARVTEAIADALNHAGLQAVDLEAEGVAFPQTTGLVVPDGRAWRIAAGKDDLLHQFRDQLHLRGLIALQEGTVVAALECTGGPCSVRYVDRPGLYTRSVLTFTRYYAVAAFKWNLFVLDPPADMATADTLDQVLQAPGVPLISYGAPANFYNLTEAEFAPVRDAIVKYATYVTDNYAEALNAR